MNKNFTNEEAVAKVKVLMSRFYESVGREEFEDVDIKREELIEDIDDIINKTNISNKHLVVEKLNFEEMERE